jgi:hypothetical protein
MGSYTEGDRHLEELVHERRMEVKALQRAESDQAKDFEDRGQQHLNALKQRLGAELRKMLGALDKLHASAAEETKDGSTRSESDSARSKRQPQGRGNTPVSSAQISPHHKPVNDRSVARWQRYSISHSGSTWFRQVRQ